MKETINCEEGRSWSTEVWLLMAILLSSNGFLISFTRIFIFPTSWFATVVCINIYRLIFNITPTMPIILDMGVSLFLQWVITYNWTLGVSTAFLLNGAVFTVCYFWPLLQEYMLLKEKNPGSKPPVVDLIYPLPIEPFGKAFLCIYFLNGGLLMIAWFTKPFHGVFCSLYRDFVGCVLVLESLVFLSCYNEMSSANDVMRVKLMSKG